MAENRITQSALETLDGGTPAVRETQTVIEIIDRLSLVYLRLTQVSIEILETDSRLGIIVGGAFCPTSI